eukprot:GHRR01016751.1.p1 GENE.GHRR01016751.1~~GHRR01016751.1.p1  ORF type:complete len:171 (+),score=66.00 GHRR01016751.1:1510-2022(+)
MTFSTEEFELIDRLRQKYAQEDVTKASAVLQATLSKDQEHDQAGSARSVDRLVDAHICPVCQGSGRHAEVYHFRRLVSNCSHCDGDGLLMSGGKPSKATESGNKAAAANSTTHQAATSQAVMDSGSNAGSQAKRLKSTRQLKRQVQQLEQQMQAVTKVGAFALHDHLLVL